MHWSKTRHITYENCPRKFFYSEIAASRNDEIRALARRTAAPLVRHEIVRKIVLGIARTPDAGPESIARAVSECEVVFQKASLPEHVTAEQMTIVQTCVQSFVDDVVPDIVDATLLHAYSGRPAEFTYDRLSMMCLPELVLDAGDVIDVLAFKTGSSSFRSQHELRLRAGGLTCWARSALRVVDRPIRVSEVYLRERGEKYSTELSDADVREFIRAARDTARQYSASAKIRDFPAKPDWSSCRFCPYQEICPEWEDFAEVDFAITALGNFLEDEESETPDHGVDKNARTIFLCHVSEDKDEFVRPLARALEAAGLTYWLDEAEVKWGASLIKSINAGLRTSSYLLCFLSRNLLERGWPSAELEAAFTQELGTGVCKVLPLILDEDPTEVLEEYPLLRGKKYLRWGELDVMDVVNMLKGVMLDGGAQ